VLVAQRQAGDYRQLAEFLFSQNTISINAAIQAEIS